MNLNYRSLRQPTGARHSYTNTERLLAAEMLAILKHGGDVRADKVAHLREELSADNYENDLKLEVAVMKLLEELETD